MAFTDMTVWLEVTKTRKNRFKVVKTKNTIDPRIGDILDEDEVRTLIGNPLLTVNVS